MNGFYEWHRTEYGKQPYYLHTSDNIIGIAGLYCDGTFCMLTKEADGFIAKVHHRMPVIIPKEMYNHWMTCKIEEAQELISDVKGSNIEGYEISKRVNNPSNNDERLLDET